ncbi:transposase [Prevotella jejuni]|uniref:transposase n=1 Tax=Prevotella jejuni TaxID=1177574 RepID=UPI0028DB7E49|nr:transposase [Prevotella jejuni]
MKSNPAIYVEGVGWRRERVASLLRRRKGHDYQGRCIYMITLCTEGRQPLLGRLMRRTAAVASAYIEPTELGSEVERCWIEIPKYYPEVSVLAFQVMPDHIHGILFVTHEMAVHLGKVINGFKVGCNRAYRRLVLESSEAMPQKQGQDGRCGEGAKQRGCKHPEHGMLFAPGYHDSVLRGKGQLENMFRYIADNPRRLALKRDNPQLFRVVNSLKVGDRTFSAIGNQWLLEHPIRLQVRCHNNKTPENLRLIALQKEYFLARGREGGVLVSPCISAGEKEIARAALEEKLPLIVLLENGFPPFYKPPGPYFDACCEGRLLMLAPWAYHHERRTISREQCQALNSMSAALSNEAWTTAFEQELLGYTSGEE